MSYITPARRVSQIPLEVPAGLVATNQPVRHAVAEPATHKYIALGGLKVLTEAAVRCHARHFRVALDPETESCILIGPSRTFRRSTSAC